MRDAILTLPTQLAEGIRLGRERLVTRPFRNVICCGMGGSSIAGELYSLIADNAIVHWDYGMPAHVGAQDIAVLTSWSGDTEEVLSSYAAARAAGMETLCITSGGELAEVAQRDGTPLVRLPAVSIPPRAATGYMAGALLAALGMADKLPTSWEVAGLEAHGKELASSIGDSMLALYAAYPWRKLTGFWKMSYSETVKRQVMANWLPSGAHTEVVGWEGPYAATVRPLFFRDDTEDPRHAKSLDALLALLKAKGYTCLVVRLQGAAVLEKALNAHALGLWTAYHAAQNLGVDPQATVLLDEFKKLKNK
jgi:glucose/mannose-6-phosphate isomerase